MPRLNSALISCKEYLSEIGIPDVKFRGCNLDEFTSVELTKIIGIIQSIDCMVIPKSPAAQEGDPIRVTYGTFVNQYGTVLEIDTVNDMYYVSLQHSGKVWVDSTYIKNLSLGGS